MAIFKNKVTATKKAEPTSKSKSEAEGVAIATTKTSENVATTGKGLDLSMILLRPHVTEKASDSADKGVYAFEVNKRANKQHIRAAIEKYFKVKPVKIAIVNGASKLMKNPRTNRVQVKKVGIKKALVYLKKGDKIEFV